MLLMVLVTAQNRSATLRQTTLNVTGETFKDVFFDASDTINTSETYYVEFTAKKNSRSIQDVYLAGSAVTGSGDVVITVQGKKFTDSDYADIGTTTWNSTLTLDEVISVTTSNAYRFFKVRFVSDGTAKQVLVTDIRFKMYLVGEDLSSSSLALSGALTVGTTLTVTGETTLNNHLNMGAGDDILLSSTSDITVNTDKFTVSGADGNTVIDGTVDIAGLSTLAGGLSITANVTQFTTLTTLTVTEIVGTSAGDVGHVDGAILVAAPGTGFAHQFVSIFFVYDHDTADYGGGGDDVAVQVGVNSTQVTVTGAVTGANLLEASGDKMLGLGSTATELVFADNGIISLFGTALTDPGTAVGVLRCYVTYNVITTGL